MYVYKSSVIVSFTLTIRSGLIQGWSVFMVCPFHHIAGFCNLSNVILLAEKFLECRKEIDQLCLYILCYWLVFELIQQSVSGTAGQRGSGTACVVFVVVVVVVVCFFVLDRWTALCFTSFYYISTCMHAYALACSRPSYIYLYVGTYIICRESFFLHTPKFMNLYGMVWYGMVWYGMYLYMRTLDIML